MYSTYLSKLRYSTSSYTGQRREGMNRLGEPKPRWEDMLRLAYR